MQKWEYCTVSGVGLRLGIATHYPSIVNFNINSPRGYTITELKKTKIDDEWAVVAKTIAQLGEEGWELVNLTSPDVNYVQTLIFKRPKEWA